MKRYLLHIMILGLFISFHVSGYTQNIIFHHLTTEEGLSQFSVNGMYIDETGQIWIATRDGLNKYNGVYIQTYKQEKNNPYSLLSNNVLSIAGNRHGAIYLLCSDGLSCLHVDSQRFTTLLYGSIGCICYGDRLYISIKNKVYAYDEQMKKFKLYCTVNLPNCNIVDLHLDRTHRLWIGTENYGFGYADRKGNIKTLIGNVHVSRIYEDREGNIWIGTWENGLYCVHNNLVMTHYVNIPGNPNTISSNFVRSCCEDNSGNIWIGAFNGLNKYDTRTKTFSFYTSNRESTSLSHSSVWGIVKDLQGTIWLGTYFGGVNYFNPENEIYTVYRPSLDDNNGLSNAIVGRMIEDGNHRLWICTEGGGITVYDRIHKTYKWYKHSDSDNNTISHNNVKAIYYDRQRDCMWIGTHLGGLNKLDIRSGRFTHYRSNPNDPQSLPSDIIRDIVPYGENLIIGTQNGVCLFDSSTGKCQQMFKNDDEGRLIHMVADLQMDAKGRLWIAATGDGVFLYDFRTRKLMHFVHDKNNPNSLSDNNVNNIYLDSSKRLWLSTSGSGLDLYHEANRSFTNYDSGKNGFASDCIYQVCESQKDELLLITTQGFVRFNTRTQQIKNYSKANGFPLTAINENALFIAYDKTVFLGGVQGMISFKLKDLNFVSKPYNILISRLFVNGKEVRVGDDTGILKQDIGYTHKIILHSNQSMFSIELATNNYVTSNKEDLIYQLSGFSNDWNSIRQQNSITYTNLNPGKYVLRIKPADPNSLGKETQIEIVILPPWYRTAWAYLLYLVLIGGLLYYIIHTYKSHVKLEASLNYEQKHLKDVENLNQSKLRFFTNISHEFRTPLTLIVGQMESLLQLPNLAPSIYNKILAVYKNSLSLKDLISELLDFRKQEQGMMKIKVEEHNIVNFLYENYLLFLTYANSKKINLSFRKSDDEIKVWFDQKQIQKVINNLLSNALKNTEEGGSIILSVEKETDAVLMKVTDTGCGIPAKDLEKIFDRFYQTEETESNSAKVGTGIGLALTKGIVELHHGEIHIESELGKGSTFMVELPLGNQLFAKEEISEGTTLQNAVVNMPLAEYELEEPEVVGLSHRDNHEAVILIVEDNEDIRHLLCDLFEPLYQVVSAVDGLDALEKIKEKEPNLILSDVLMPRMSGIELCREVKNNFDTCHIPVVLLTARTAIEHNLEGLQIGADDYITKPFDSRILISRCNNLVNSRFVLQEKFSKQPTAQAQILATNAMDKDLLDKSIAIIEKHISDEEFNIMTFSKELGMARTNLFAKLKAITGKTPNDFILSIRLKKSASLLLNNPELNITEISERTGFSSPRYFSKCFKDAYKINPLSYRKGEKVGTEGEKDADEDLPEV